MPSQSPPSNVPKAVQDCHELLLWIIPCLDQFPRSRRFTLGERLEQGLLQILENLVQAAFSKQKREPLSLANRRLEVCRHLWRLAFKLQTIPSKRYEHGSRLMNDLGRQIGGWLKGSAA